MVDGGGTEERQENSTAEFRPLCMYIMKTHIFGESKMCAVMLKIL